jgi:hypothetical protein
MVEVTTMKVIFDIVVAVIMIRYVFNNLQKEIKKVRCGRKIIGCRHLFSFL